jgi:predicted DNA-binding transcriptional regulator AlpA
MMASDLAPEPTDDVERLVDIKFIADRLRVTPETVREMVKRNEFPPPMRLGTLQRWRVAVFNAWVAQRDAEKQ